MNKRLGAGLLAAVSTASVLGIAAAPSAAAIPPCGSYPPGQHYIITRSPASGTVRRNTIVQTRGTLHRSGQPCRGFRLEQYVKYDNARTFHLNGSGTTDSNGSVQVSVKASRTFRYFYSLTLSRTSSVRSLEGEIRVR